MHLSFTRSWPQCLQTLCMVIVISFLPLTSLSVLCTFYNYIWNVNLFKARTFFLYTCIIYFIYFITFSLICDGNHSCNNLFILHYNDVTVHFLQLYWNDEFWVKNSMKQGPAIKWSWLKHVLKIIPLIWFFPTSSLNFIHCQG